MCRLQLSGAFRKGYEAVRAERDADLARSRILDLIARLEAARIAARVAREAAADVAAT